MSAPLGPYSPVVRAGDFVIVSGQGGMKDGAIVDGGVAAQTTQTIANLAARLAEAGASLADVVAHFDRAFGLALTQAQRDDLVAYLEAVGDAGQPFEPMTRQSEMSELAAYVAVLDDAIGRADQPAIDLVVDTVVRDLGFIARRFDNRDPRTGRIRRPDRPDVARIAQDLAAHMTSVGARSPISHDSVRKTSSTATA